MEDKVTENMDHVQIFTTMREDQQLTMEFAQLYPILKELINDAKNGQVKITLELNNYDETAELFFQQDQEFRIDTLLILAFNESKVDTIKAYVSYKINATKQHNYLVQERIKDICKIIEDKNPTLMKEIKKGSVSGL